MRARTSALVTLAAAAVALGVAVPALAMSGSPDPAKGLADAPGSGQSVVDWNRQLITILGTPNAQPATIHPTRSFAMLQAAEYDAVVSITRTAPAYKATVTAAADARPDAAADQAAHDVLAALYPTNHAGADDLLRTELAAVPDGGPKQDGVAVGQAAASQLLTLRKTDGATATPAPYTPGTQPGDYRPTPPKLAASMYTNWGSVTPFVLSSGNQFRPPAHPAVTSAAYASALAEVENLGRDSSTTRSADQTVAGKFWSASPIWNTWNQITQKLVGDRKASLTDATRAFAALDLSLADTTIGMYDAKYTDHVWRPITAIRAGVPGLAADAHWNPLTPTAADPSYPGAHSALSAAAATALGAVWGDRQTVAVTSSADAGVTRSFTSLTAVADEAALSRIWSGQHTRIDDQAGRQLGRQVAGAVLGALQVAPGA
ncbi:MAG: vanadium-dependent haloperoxidase [Pseudonocardia sp.]|nr:vanadium-dependent haloperoxidase [Pseudonocardia sp.]